MDSVRPAILMVTFNGWEMTLACLKGIYPLVTEDGWEIVVTDNASTDGTPQKIKALFPRVRCIALDRNVGFGAANNRAAQEVPQAKQLILLNNDTLLSAETLRGLASSHEQAQTRLGQAIVMAPQVLFPNREVQPNWCALPRPARFFRNAFLTETQAAHHIQGPLLPVSGMTLYEAGWTSAVCWVFPRPLWEKLRGFDERIFMYNEDLDLAWRASHQGARFLLDTSLQLIHLGGGSAVSSFSRSSQHDLSLQYVLGKHWGFSGILLSKTFRITRSLLRILLLAPRAWQDSSTRAKLVLHARLLGLVFKGSSPRL